MHALLNVAERPWVSLAIGTAIGIFSIILSIILYRRSLVRKSMSFVKVEVEILAVNSPSWESELEIKYKGVEITKLTAARVGIWNSGNTTIEFGQVIASEPLIVKVPEDSRLLVCHATSVSRSVIKARVGDIEGNQARVMFDFLDPGDGFVLHIAQSSPRNTLKVVGTIKGLPHGLTEFLVRGRLGLQLARSSLVPVIIMGFGTLLSDILARSVGGYYGWKEIDWQYRALNVTLFITTIILAVVSVFLEKLIQRRRSSNMPKAVRSDPVIAATMGVSSK